MPGRHDMATLATSPLVNRVEVRPFGADFAFASITLPAVRLAGIRASRDGTGRVTLRPPMIAAGGDRERPAYAFQPGFAEQLAQAVAEVWRRADADGGAGRGLA
ncbi:hypothetical protein [Siccirubricoccus phaeus]|uniref:hypothetical protein n=1 Tax=Siccirubricoccus phaeus TaxID=2595053 RepID=UPI0011F38E30|nr:hypothetical protein [Siccirubricoccus phaeus]